MSTQYYLSTDDLNPLISKAYLDGQDAVRLALLNLRDIAIQRKEKAIENANAIERMKAENPLFVIECGEFTDRPSKISTEFGEMIAHPYYLGEVSGLIARSQREEKDELPSPGTRIKSKLKSQCQNCGCDLYHGVCATHDCANASANGA